MAISKVSGKAWADIAKVDGVSATDIAKVSGIDAPSVQGTASIVTDNLFAHYDAALVSGSTVLDQSGNGYNMTMYNGAYAGTFQGAPTFITDGVNDRIYASIAQTEFSSVDYPITMEAWHYYDSSTNYTSAFVINDPADTVDWLRNLIISNNGRAFAQVYTWSGQRYTQIDIANHYTSSGWYLQAVTIERTPSGGRHNLRLYVNGSFILENSVPQVFQYNSSQFTIVPWSEQVGHINISIGCLIRASPSHRLGRTGEARFYTDKLTDAEILQNFNATKSKYGY